MTPHTVISAVVSSFPHQEPSHNYVSAGPSRPRRSLGGTTYATYGATSASGPTTAAAAPRGLQSSPAAETRYGSVPIADEGDDAYIGDGYDDDTDSESDEPLAVIDVSWKYMSRLYLLVPVVTLLFLASLILLVTFAWPPNKAERDSGQVYPHPFFYKAFLIGLFASFTVQSLRVPIWVVTSWLGLSGPFTSFLATTVHAILHELVRLSSLPLTVPSPTSGFHSSYYLGLGWGVAEAAWGIVQGWDQLALYEDVMGPTDSDLEAAAAVAAELDTTWKPDDNGVLGGSGLDVVHEESELEEDDELARREEEAELERRVGILERMRGRQELEDVIGVPFPNIPFPLHLLWRLDTLLLNLGLTLILSAYYFDPSPLYKHGNLVGATAAAPHTHTREWPITEPNEPSRWLPLVWVLVCLLHVSVSLVWKVVGRVGVGAVTWGGLIVALGSVFAGLGAWGGLV